MVQRVILQSFYIKFQLITMTELNLHDITVQQPLKYYLSFILNLAFQQIVIIELIRAYMVLREKHTQKNMERISFDKEKKQIHAFWTKGLKQKEIDRGNTFFVRQSIRWSLIQLEIVGLQGIPIAQISLIALTQLVYFVLILK